MSNPFQQLDERLERIEKILLNAEHAPANDTLLSKKDVCELLGISLNTLDTYTKNKTIPCYGIGSKVVFKRNEVIGSLICLNK